METIFVSVASYRDASCGATIRSLYEMAEAPDRVFVGTCEQNDLMGLPREECVNWDDPMMRKFYKNVRRIQLSSSDAEGPCYARFLCSLLYKGEDYFMQIDSHSMLVRNWDTKCIQILKMLPEKSLLSYYPIPADRFQPEPSEATQIPVIKSAFINQNGLLQWHPGIYTSMGDKPVPVPFIAAGFIFAPGSFVRDVPFDPSLPYLFMGEESLLSMRAFTSGYNIYTPHKSIIYHRYLRSSEPSVYTDHKWSDNAAVNRAARICGLVPGHAPIHTPKPADASTDLYGLGHIRSPGDFFRLIGIRYDESASSVCDEPDKKAIKSSSTHHIIIIVILVIACAIASYAIIIRHRKDRYNNH